MDAAIADKAPGAIAYYIRTANEYLDANGDHSIADFTLRHMDRLKARLAERGLSAASINIRMQNIGTFLRWCYERGEIDRVPRIRQLRKEKRLPKVLTDEQATSWVRYLQSVRRWKNGSPAIVWPDGVTYTPAGHHRRAAHLRERFIRIGMDTGCRLGELFHARLDQFDTDAGMLRIEFQQRFKPKDREEKEVPLTSQARRLIRAIRKVYPLEKYLLDDGAGRPAYKNEDTFGQMLARDMKVLCFPKGIKRAHGFRALFAHRLRERGAPLDAIKNLLGHSDIKVTEGYFPESHTRERAAIALLE